MIVVDRNMVDCFFFFQAEDGIRDVAVTGVQTCALPISLTFANLMGNVHDPAIVAPMQYEEIDIGETLPARCLRQALWLSRIEDTPFALLLSPAERFGRTDGVHLEIAVPPGERGSDLSRQFF